MNAQVVCRVRAGVTLTFKIKEKEEALVGRDPAIAVSVPVEGVSRQHAKIRWDGKAYWLEDLKSTNGTFLNGQAVFRERLKHLDVIGLGRKIDLVFMLRAPEEAAAAPSPARQGIVAASLVAEGEGLAPIEIGSGEMTLGRAASNNVVAESSSVSKVHARIERSADQLLLEDLGSANGTFVNGAKIMTAFLKDGDVVSLAGVEGYRVSITLGEVKSFGTSARMRAPVIPAERQRFAGEWKTRFEWDSGEREALEDLRRQVRERERDREAQKAGKADGGKTPAAKGHGAANPAAAKPAAAPARPAASAAAKPAAAAEKPAAAAKPAAAPEKPAPAEKPAAPAARPAAPEKPAAPPAAKPAAPPAPAPAKPEAPPAVKPAAPPVAKPPAPPQPAPPKPSQAAPPPAPAAAKAPPLPPKPAPAPPAPTAPPPTVAAPPAPVSAPRPAPAAKAAAILEIRLTAPGFDLSAKETGAHELGRANEAALRVNHPTVSRKHARIILADDRGIAYLQDAGGANGTRLNGTAIERLAPLADGDKVGVGEVELTVTLRRG